MKQPSDYTLYVGGDESNHGDESRAEIDVATFSRLEEDSIVVPFPNRKHHSALDSWLSSSDRDYLFAILSSEKYRSLGSNLPFSIPDLIYRYLPQQECLPRRINIFLDGQISPQRLRNMKEDISRFYRGEVGIQTFIKKQRNSSGNLVKRPNCPAVVYYADIISNTLNHFPAGELFAHPKLAFVG